MHFLEQKKKSPTIIFSHAKHAMVRDHDLAQAHKHAYHAMVQARCTLNKDFSCTSKHSIPVQEKESLVLLHVQYAMANLVFKSMTNLPSISPKVFLTMQSYVLTKKLMLEYMAAQLETYS